MQRWEYRTIRADWFSGGLRVIVPERKTVPLDTHLAELGADGWEVVSMQYTPFITDPGKLLILLKRPLPA